ncbi:MAG: hypothetical protein LBB91_11510 [Clostridiales bacterium]|nr:hypothetical protein [Clostridiales bacterium]
MPGQVKALLFVLLIVLLCSFLLALDINHVLTSAAEYTPLTEMFNRGQAACFLLPYEANNMTGRTQIHHPTSQLKYGKSSNAPDLIKEPLIGESHSLSAKYLIAFSFGRLQ